MIPYSKDKIHSHECGELSHREIWKHEKERRCEKVLIEVKMEKSEKTSYERNVCLWKIYLQRH